MKTLFAIAALLVGFVLSTEAQEKSVKKGDVYLSAEEMPEYPGGQAGLIAFISENVKYPEKAKAEKIEGKVFVSFIVDKNGEVTHPKIER